VGKSSLVNQWLGKLAMNHYRGARRVYGWSFFSQGQRNTTALAHDFLSEALKRMGDPAPTLGSVWERGERLARYIQQERMVLILDGLEPLQAQPGPTWGRLKDPGLAVLVRELAFFNPGLCVITSRVRVTDIDHFRNTTAPAIELEGLSEAAGAELLRILGVGGSQDELQQASREFGGHGLALNLLGTYLSNARNGDIRARSEFHIFEERLEEGQQAEAMLQSYETWFGEERPELAVLRMLGLFDRPVESEWMDALLEPPAIPGLTAPLVGLSEPAWQRVLSYLRQAQLLAKASAPNLDMLDTHPLVRAYFGHQLKARFPEAWKQGNDRLYEYFASQARSLSPTSEARGPLQLAIAHGCRAGRHDEVFEQLFLKRLVGGTYLSLLWVGGFDRASEFLAALAHFFEPPWRKPAAVFPDELKLQMHWNAAELLMYLGRMPEAVEPLLDALDNPRLHEHPHQAACVFGALCMVYVFLGEPERAVQYGERAVGLSRKTGVARQHSRQLASLAWALTQCGRSAKAEEFFLHATSLPRGEDWLKFLFVDLAYCDLLLDQGRTQEVFRRLGSYVDWARSSGSWQLMGMLQLCLGNAHLRRSAEAPEALGLALEFLSEGILLMRKQGTPMLITPALTSRAAVHRLRGSFELAWRDLDEALFISTGAGTRLFQVDVCLERCRLFLAMGKLAQARTELGAARKLVLLRGYHRRDRELAELIAQVSTPSMASVDPGPGPLPRG
jgi:tetratricopeptide (TPR) repeat protein